MSYVVPNFEPDDMGARELNPRFLLDTHLGRSQLILRYSEGVRFAARMLSEPDDRRFFVEISKILAFSEMQGGGIGRIRPIGWGDITELTQLQNESN